MLNPDTIVAALEVEGTGPIGRAVVDGAVVIYDYSDPPAWFQSIRKYCDENGNTATEITDWEPRRAPLEGEYIDPQPVSVPLS